MTPQQVRLVALGAHNTIAEANQRITQTCVETARLMAVHRRQAKAGSAEHTYFARQEKFFVQAMQHAQELARQQLEATEEKKRKVPG